MDLSDIDISDLQKLPLAERQRLIRMIQQTIDIENRPDVPAEPDHQEAVREARSRFRNGGQGKPVEGIVGRLRAKR